jgi:hypothetical protein
MLALASKEARTFREYFSAPPPSLSMTAATQVSFSFKKMRFTSHASLFRESDAIREMIAELRNWECF